MSFPDAYDFLQAFGLEPEEDSSMGYFRYLKKSYNDQIEIDFSFSAICYSFQVVLLCSGHKLATISSEQVQSIKLRKDKLGSGINVVFDIQGVTSEALIILEPELSCKWWTLSS